MASANRRSQTHRPRRQSRRTRSSVTEQRNSTVWVFAYSHAKGIDLAVHHHEAAALETAASFMWRFMDWVPSRNRAHLAGLLRLAKSEAALNYRNKSVPGEIMQVEEQPISKTGAVFLCEDDAKSP